MDDIFLACRLSTASVRYIRPYEEDYSAKPVLLTDNHRSSGRFVSAAHEVIAESAERIKTGRDITIGQARLNHDPGGVLAMFAAVAQGRVQILAGPSSNGAQAMSALDQLQRLSQVSLEWNGSRAAISASDWRRLAPTGDDADSLGSAGEWASDQSLGLWGLRDANVHRPWIRACAPHRANALVGGARAPV